MTETQPPVRPKDRSRDPGFEKDFSLWIKRQAQLLREGRFELLDLEHLATEIDDMAGRERRELSTRLKVLVGHLLKWQFQPGKRTRSWRSTIRDQRDEIRELLEQSPSLRRQVASLAGKRYRVVVENTADETGLVASDLPATCPYSARELLDDDFLPGTIDAL
jgi:Domain of unknown function DUF29